MIERALLVVIELGRHATWSLSDEEQELAELVRSCGGRPIEVVRCKREAPSPTYFVGQGKAEEIAASAHERQAQIVIFNEELSPAQQRNLQKLFKIKTIDRTQLILDIFAQRARSQEGKVQVELAQLNYALPRLAGLGPVLSRLGGGIGTRGPGETMLETDRRHIRTRILRLQRELKTLEQRRAATRKQRHERQTPTVALVGYTNAGKTTLLNALTDAGAAAENRLFTTLDPLSRRYVLPNHQTVIFSDTVGFLHRLPHHLIEAFHATLEEVVQADLLIHVLDASHPQALEYAQAVRDVLAEIGATEKLMLTALNKMDHVHDAQSLRALTRVCAPAVTISAKTAAGLDQLVDWVSQHLTNGLVDIDITLPLNCLEWLHAIYTEGRVHRREDHSAGVHVVASVPQRLQARLTAALRASPQHFTA